jgi:hypothetical protein
MSTSPKELAQEIDNVNSTDDAKDAAEVLRGAFQNLGPREKADLLHEIIMSQEFNKGMDPLTVDMNTHGDITALYFTDPFNKTAAFRVSESEVRSVDRRPIDYALSAEARGLTKQ